MKKRLLKLATMALLFVAAMTTGRAQNIPITLNQGWNWISYPYSESMTIPEALSGFTPVNGDVISSQTNGSSTYNNGTWRGSLTTLVPGQGYMYKSVDGTTRTFIFGGAANDPTAIPAEALEGEFTVDANGTKVRFSPGNLQCRVDPNQEVYAEVGTWSENSTHMPYDTYYCYSLCQMIYKAQELYKMGLAAGYITSIYFEDVSWNFYNRNNVEVWMSATTATTASSTSVSTSGMTRVFAGPVIGLNGTGTWIEIPFSTDFNWDGTSNVIVTVVMNQGRFDSSTDWGCCSPGFTCSSYAFNDSDGAYYPSSNTYSMTTSTLRPRTLFKGHGGATWRFAEKQWDCIREGNNNLSSSYSGWFDLFGWATSGHKHGATCWQPWSTTGNNNGAYYAYGSASYNLNDRTGEADWGCNPISNGGNQPFQWRTLTNTEWSYVFNTRNTTSGMRFARARVQGVNGIILLPDNWNTSYYTLNNTNIGPADYTTNTITSAQWPTLEQHGAVFLPAAGYRNGTSFSTNVDGFYWSASYRNESQAYYLSLLSSGVNTSGYTGRSYGGSVRLVCQTNPRIRTLGVTTGNGSATVSAEIDYTGTVTERGICYNTYAYVMEYALPYNTPTMSSSHQASGSGTGSFNVQLTRWENPSLFNNKYFLVRAYAKIGGTYYYGNIVQFEMPDDGSHGYAGVDLGLPSGTLWATCNVGASNPEDYGNYYAWGERTTKSDYSWATYQHCNGSSSTLTKYCTNSEYGYNGFVDNILTLLPEDDPATYQWGGDWRTPTVEEWQELRANTTVTWTQQNGVNGRRFTAPNGNSIFLPAAGCRSGTSVNNAGTYCLYWLSSPYDTPTYAHSIYCTSGQVTYIGGSRFNGNSIRAVRSPRRN